MPKAEFLLPDGERRVIEAPEGWSLMEAARKEGVPGIIAECGGGAICSTCHVIVERTWCEVVGTPSPTEDLLLEDAPEREETSRLSCQVIMTPDLDGITVKVPSEQA